MGMPDITIRNHLDTYSTYQDIYEQYVSEASFLWALRSIAVNEPHNDINDLLSLETRIAAPLNGLMTSMDMGWQACEEALDIGEPGEVFTALNIAMRSHDSAKIKTAVDVGLSSKFAVYGLVSAMGWLADDIANIWIERFLNGKDLQHKYLGIAACSVRRYNPGNILTTLLQREDCVQHPLLYARVLRLVGELRRQDCLPYIHATRQHEDDSIRFWAIWSVILLGQHHHAELLRPYIFKANAYQDKAIQIAFRVLPTEQAREWISELSKDAKQIRAIIKAIGVLGDPHAVNWLINKMENPLYAKLAAESFTYITGVDFGKNDLSIKTPDKHPSVIPNEDNDDDIVALDDDENLPYPDAEKVASIWQKYGQKFIVGKRYFLGQPLNTDHLKDRLQNGMQRQRHAAALELALHENGMPLVNTKARVLN